MGYGDDPVASIWEAYLADLTDDEPPELAFYCPDCASREFGGD
jgi:hypothetical protein